MPKFVPRERKHRRRAKEVNAASGASRHGDANTELIVPESATERDIRRKELQAELRAQQPQDKIKSKKRKRLDHYIETKLKREENAELINKLAKQKIDTNLLQSSKRLGQVNETKQEAFRRALNERKAGIDVLGDQEEILFQKRREVPEQVPFEALITSAQPDVVEEEPSEEPLEVTKPAAQQASTSLFGSGLKRSLDSNETGQPIIKRRKRRKKAKNERVEAVADDTATEDEPESEVGEDEWAGFGDGNGDNEPTSEREDEPAVLPAGDTLDSDIDDDDDSQNSGSTASEEGSDTSDAETSSEDEEAAQRPARSSAFKQWAELQRNDALGFTPSTAPVNDPEIKAKFRPRQPSPDPTAKDLQTTNGHLARPQNALVITRTDEVQKVRLALPVVQEEQRIVEAIHNHPVVIVCGATGSGKTTQVPQMLFESGYGSHCGTSTSTTSSLQNRGMIGVTQPRRVAAVSVANRVSTELGDEYKSRVAHQVRYDTTTTKQTAIKFMTDGILLREINEDFILSKYSAIVIDEAHERSVNTDILIGTLSRIVTLRDELTKEQPDTHYPLKLIIMSATLRVADFAQNQRLFHGLPPPIVEAEGRQYPVTIHFARRTQRDYVADIVKKVTRGHKKLPAGAMLVFLTGQNEINSAARLLRKALGNTAGVPHAKKSRESADEVPLEIDDLDVATNHEGDLQDEPDTDIHGLSDDDDEDDEFDLGEDAEEDPSISNLGTAHSNSAHILTLYAALPTAQQMRIFQPPPTGSRLIVLATNVAETSLTIPGIKYVFDCGRSKEKKYDQATGVQTFEIDWISKASASQRTGRAGRTGPGHCWRLYSSAVYEEFFAEHSLPEILRSPIEGTILQLKSMNIDNVVNFPFPTPPERSQLQTAETLLKNLGALDSIGKITKHGRALMQYPVSPRYSKMLQIASSNGILEHTIALVAGLAVGDLYVPELQTTSSAEDAPENSDSDSDNEARIQRAMSQAATTEAQKRHQSYTRAQALMGRWDDRSDVIKLLTAVAAHADAVSSDHVNGGSKISQDLYLREKGMTEVQQLRQQLHAIIRAQHRHSSVSAFKLALTLAEYRQRKMLNQVVAAGFLDQIAIRADLLPNAQTGRRKPRSAIEVPYLPLFPLDDVDHTAAAEEQEEQRSVYVHPSSVLARLSKTEMPNYIVYSHLSRAAVKTIGSTRALRTRMHPLTTISAKALAVLAQDTPLLELGKPVGKIEDKDGGRSRICWIAVSLRPVVDGKAAGVEWPMGAWKVEQSRTRKGDWEIAKVLAR